MEACSCPTYCRSPWSHILSPAKLASLPSAAWFAEQSDSRLATIRDGAWNANDGETYQIARSLVIARAASAA